MYVCVFGVFGFCFCFYRISLLFGFVKRVWIEVFVFYYLVCFVFRFIIFFNVVNDGICCEN